MAITMIRPGAPTNVPAAGGQETTNKFATGRHYRTFLDVTGTVTAGSFSACATNQDSPWTFMKRLEIKSRRGSYVIASGEMLFFLDKYESKGLAATSTIPTISGNGAVNFAMRIPINHSPRDLLTPESLLADMRDGQEPQIVTNFGATTDLYTPSGGTTLALSAVAADLSIEEEDEPIAPRFVRVLEQTIKPIVQAQQDLQIPLTAKKGRQTQRIVIRARLNGARDNTIVNEVKLYRASGQLIFRAKWAQLQESVRYWVGASLDTGIAVIDFDRLHLLARLPQTETFSAYVIEFDVNAPNNTTDVTVLVSSVVADVSFGS